MSEPGWPDGVVLRRDESLARHLPLRVGGPCDAYVVVHAAGALPAVLAACRDAGWSRTIVGSGSRLVVRDGGLAGAVIRLGLGYAGFTADGEGTWVGAATALARVARLDARWTRLRFAPGTLGASLACDPGWEPHVDRVRVVGRGAEKEVAWSELGPLGNAVITAARLKPGVDAPSPGPRHAHAFWLAPDDQDAQALVREVSLAGARLRRVLIPEGQADSVVNLGGADARDVLLLQRSVLERVTAQRGVTLVERQQWLGRVS